TATSGSLTSATSSGINITAGTVAKLAITDVNGGANPAAGVGFPVTVQSQDAGGNPTNVTGGTALGFSLSRTAGTGTLGGTLSGTIAIGANTVTVSGVTYSKAESGVVITATRTSGPAATAGSSAPFTVDIGPASKLAITSVIATKLAITSVNGGSNPTAGTAFSVTVRSEDANGNFSNVSAATGVSLTLKTGTGTLGGTLTGTIAASSSTLTISGVTYTRA